MVDEQTKQMVPKHVSAYASFADTEASTPRHAWSWNSYAKYACSPYAYTGSKGMGITGLFEI